jgi:DNA-directed RNA polymerase specialized sigma subunit
MKNFPALINLLMNDLEEKIMVGTNSPVIYVSQGLLDRLADKHSLDEYLKKEGSDDIHTDFRFLVGPKLKHILTAALKELPEEERHLILMRYWEDLSTEEIGFSLGVEEVSIRHRLTKVLAKLRAHILAKMQVPEKPGGRGQLCTKLCC